MLCYTWLLIGQHGSFEVAISVVLAVISKLTMLPDTRV